MTIQDQITAEQSVITALRNQLRNIRLPARTINWQHQNVVSPGRGGVRQRLLVKKQQAQINTQITSSQNKIISLRELIFG